LREFLAPALAKGWTRNKQPAKGKDMANPTKLEEKLAHLTRTVDEMSDIVARQEKEIALLTNRVRLLMEREVERQQDAGGHVVLGDERPPHY
jgi:SlyX protein